MKCGILCFSNRMELCRSRLRKSRIWYSKQAKEWAHPFSSVCRVQMMIDIHSSYKRLWIPAEESNGLHLLSSLRRKITVSRSRHGTPKEAGLNHLGLTRMNETVFTVSSCCEILPIGRMVICWHILAARLTQQNISNLCCIWRINSYSFPFR